MSISEREQQALVSIEEDLAGSVPELAAKLAVFTRLTAGEAMPPRERVWRPARTSPASPATASASPGSARAWPGLRRRTVWRLMAVVAVLAILALAFAASHGASHGICTVTGAAACRQAPAHPPGRPGAGAAGVKGG
jgi:anti-sigma-K factor RskA